MAKKKIIKELKRPDQFVDFWTHAWTRGAAVLKERQKPVITGAVALVVVLAGSLLFEKLDADKKIVASEALVRVQKLATADLETTQADPQTPQKAGDSKDEVPRFKTSGERQAAVLKELDDFLGKHSSSPLRGEALVMQGTQLLDAARFDDAIAAFNAAIAAKLDARLRFLAHEGQGYAYEGKGDLDKAAAAFGELERDAAGFQGFYKDRALYQKARVSERKGDKAGAVTLYRQVLDKSPDSLLHDDITDRLAVLEAK